MTGRTALNSFDKFIAQAAEIVQRAAEREIVLRILGAVAFAIHCPKHRNIQALLDRAPSDVDFVAKSAQINHIKEFFRDLGYRQLGFALTLYAGGRLAFDKQEDGSHADVFLDKLQFCHDIVLKERLAVDYPTVPLAELLLEKLQIVEINQKDIVDCIMLLREHDVGDNDKETINAKHIAMLLSEDWGFWRTATYNLQEIDTSLQDFKQLRPEDQQDVESKIRRLQEYIEKEPKSLRWRMRARIGEKKKWYREVEELTRM